MTKPNVFIFSGYGLNCEEETRTAFERAGANTDIIHLNDLIEKPDRLREYDIAAFPGGFSYADDTGSGKAYARRMVHHLADEVDRFLSRDTLMIGICNGFQILTNAGFLPGSLITNDSARFICRWVDLSVTSESPWLKGIETLSLPIAHGEGKYFDSDSNLDRLAAEDGIALTYRAGDISNHQKLPANPNGSLRDIAGITSRKGRVLGLMPHPERAVWATQRPDWTQRLRRYQNRQALRDHGDGMQLFKNAVQYFS